MSRKPKQKQDTTPNHSLILGNITPKTTNQNKLFTEYNKNKNIIAYGSAGTGKSYVCSYLALKDILNSASNFKKLYIIRSIVPTRDIGFLPGNLNEKAAYYEVPYIGIFGELFGRADAYSILKQKGIVEFATTSFMRGNTFRDCIVLADEMQNSTDHELNSLITRMGENSKIIICGDNKQCDFTKRGEESGFSKLIDIATRMSLFSSIEFNTSDIVRSEFIKEYLIERERYENEYYPPNLPQFITESVAACI